MPTILQGPRFPPEIFELILDAAAEDVVAWLKCALVCRHWLLSTRKQSYSHITLKTATDAMEFCQLLQNNHETISSHVQHFEFFPAAWNFWADVAGFFQHLQFPVFQSLHLQRIPGDQLYTHATEPFTQLKRLQLSGVEFKTMDPFSMPVAVVSRFTQLEQLALSQVRYLPVVSIGHGNRQSDPSLPKLPLPLKLSTLILNRRVEALILEMLFAEGACITKLFCTSSPNYNVLKLALPYMKETLRYLESSCVSHWNSEFDDPKIFDFSEFPALETLHFTLTTTKVLWFRHLVAPPNLEVLVLCVPSLFIQEGAIETFNPAEARTMKEWVRVGKHLCGKQFSNLRELRILIPEEVDRFPALYQLLPANCNANAERVLRGIFAGSRDILVFDIMQTSIYKPLFR
ncbi:hypothetical protein C8J56DRAFT_968162 [Mycena floridula]|nr:hypothetical protein C8J56DRAFT_968162 [Mycena floridula]